MGSSEEYKSGGASQEGELQIRYYVLCLLDVLGQTGNLKEWSVLRPDGTLPSQAETAFRRSVNTVLYLRNQFKAVFARLADRTISDEEWAKAPPDKQAAFERYKKCRLEILAFSDTLVFYAPMRNDFGDVSAVPLHRMLAACATMMMLALARRIPLRGAITIGTGLEMGEADFYGPVLAEAHGLESKCAGYPRVLVSKEVMDFIQVQGGFSEDPTIEGLQARLNRLNAELICRDTDDLYIIDYLGESMCRLSMTTPSAPHVTEMVVALYRFASEERIRFKGLADKKLEERYSRLLEYIEPRLSNWGNSQIRGNFI